jgi:murein DD-endopeptidase MepM/ murein hydrolase activator NlpD
VTGTPCYAVADGLVQEVWKDTRAEHFGFQVMLKLDGIHATGRAGAVYVVYAHLKEITAVEGERIKAGELVGYTGTTGNAVKCTFKNGRWVTTEEGDMHLHFECRPGAGIRVQSSLNNRIDPALVFGSPPRTAVTELYSGR